MMPDLNSLVLFARVAEANSFSEAARRLGMPISTVSRRVAELEGQLGVRLLERSTRSLRLTDIGSKILGPAQRGAELSETVDDLVSSQLTDVAGLLRLSSPPGLSDTLLAPLVREFQASFPEVRVKVLVTDRTIDSVAEGVDLMFRIGATTSGTLEATKLLSYRHRLLASPFYLESRVSPATPQDLLCHRLLAFSQGRPETTWLFKHANDVDEEAVTFLPHLSTNDQAGLATMLLAGGGIGELPPLVWPELLQQGRLVEVMPRWTLGTVDLWLMHVGRRQAQRPVRAFTEFAARIAPILFPDLPSLQTSRTIGTLEM
ncbi:MAG: LysR family transcriptional regulator [Janthinobacterium lividum]